MGMNYLYFRCSVDAGSEIFSVRGPIHVRWIFDRCVTQIQWNSSDSREVFFKVSIDFVECSIDVRYMFNGFLMIFEMCSNPLV